jgi:hypothetical protein
MRIARRLSAALLMFGAVTVGAESDAQDSSLRSLAKERDVNISIMSGYEPATFEMLMREADTIVVGRPVVGRPFFQGERLVTDYDVAVEQVIRRTRPPGVARGDVLVVRRMGGVLTLEGHNVIGEENDFPQFTMQDRYVFFLQASEYGSYYWVSYGPQGAFHIKDGFVQQVSQVFGSWNRERGKVSLPAFIEEIHRSARQH